MSGLLRRLTRRRPATADETVVPTPASSEPAGAPAENTAETGVGDPTAEQATQVLPATGEPPERTVVREPGIGGLCPECGEMHASDAHFCSRCGAPLDAKARAKRDAAVQAAAAPASEPAPASVLWAGGPAPRAAEEPAAE